MKLWYAACRWGVAACTHLPADAWKADAKQTLPVEVQPRCSWTFCALHACPRFLYLTILLAKHFRTRRSTRRDGCCLHHRGT